MCVGEMGGREGGVEGKLANMRGMRAQESDRSERGGGGVLYTCSKRRRTQQEGDGPVVAERLCAAERLV